MKTIIEMAREAGLIVDANQSGFDSVEAFAELVRAEAQAEEREACAKVCDDAVIRLLFNVKAGVNQVDRLTRHTAEVLQNKATAIRARGNK